MNTRLSLSFLSLLLMLGVAFGYQVYAEDDFTAVDTPRLCSLFPYKGGKICTTKSKPNFRGIKGVCTDYTLIQIGSGKFNCSTGTWSGPADPVLRACDTSNTSTDYGSCGSWTACPTSGTGSQSTRCSKTAACDGDDAITKTRPCAACVSPLITDESGNQSYPNCPWSGALGSAQTRSCTRSNDCIGALGVVQSRTCGYTWSTRYDSSACSATNRQLQPINTRVFNCAITDQPAAPTTTQNCPDIRGCDLSHNDYICDFNDCPDPAISNVDDITLTIKNSKSCTLVNTTSCRPPATPPIATQNCTTCSVDKWTSTAWSNCDDNGHKTMTQTRTINCAIDHRDENANDASITLDDGTQVSATPVNATNKTRTVTADCVAPVGGNLPQGTEGQTLRFTGTPAKWTPSSFLYNSGLAIGIGSGFSATATPTQLLTISGSGTPNTPNAQTARMLISDTDPFVTGTSSNNPELQLEYAAGKHWALYVEKKNNTATTPEPINSFNIWNGDRDLFTILPSGDIGIGTTEPETALDIRRAKLSYMTMVATEPTNDVVFSVGARGNASESGGIDWAEILVKSAHDLAFFTNDTVRAAIKSTGEFQIGSAAGFAKTASLLINGSSTIPTSIEADKDLMRVQLQNSTTITPHFVIDKTGKVGIGTDNTQGARLAVTESATTPNNGMFIYVKNGKTYMSTTPCATCGSGGAPAAAPGMQGGGTAPGPIVSGMSQAPVSAESTIRNAIKADVRTIPAEPAGRYASSWSTASYGATAAAPTYQVDLNWSSWVSRLNGVQNYTVQRLKGNDPAPTNLATQSSSTYSDKNSLQEGVQYTYVVLAQMASGVKQQATVRVTIPASRSAYGEIQAAGTSRFADGGTASDVIGSFSGEGTIEPDLGGIMAPPPAPALAPAPVTAPMPPAQTTYLSNLGDWSGTYPEWHSSWALPVAGSGIVRATVSANNPLIAFSTSQNIVGQPMYEVTLGAWGTTTLVSKGSGKSVWGHNSFSGSQVLKKDVSMPNPGQLEITVDAASNRIVVKLSGIVMAEYTDPDFIKDIKYFSFSSGSSPITFSSISVSPLAASAPAPTPAAAPIPASISYSLAPIASPTIAFGVVPVEPTTGTATGFTYRKTQSIAASTASKFAIYSSASVLASTVGLSNYTNRCSCDMNWGTEECKGASDQFTAGNDSGSVCYDWYTQDVTPPYVQHYAGKYQKQ